MINDRYERFTPPPESKLGQLEVRGQNCLINLGCWTDADVRALWLEKGPHYILESPNCGRKTLEDIRRVFGFPERYISQSEYQDALETIRIYEATQSLFS